MTVELVAVRLVDLPVGLHLRASQHLDELQRELTYVAAEPGSAPARLAQLSSRITAEFGTFARGPRAEIRAAVAAGRAVIDVCFRLPPTAAAVAALANSMLDEVEDHCRDGGLLALAAPAEVLAYRRWFFSEFTSQIGGEPPCPWPHWAGRTPGAG